LKNLSKTYKVYLHTSIRLILVSITLLIGHITLANPSAFTFSATSQKSTCPNNGIIYTFPKGGTPPYTISLITGPSYPGLNIPLALSLGKTDFLSLPAGYYVVKAQDAASAIIYDTLRVQGSYVKPTMTVTIDVNCLNYFPSGGTPPYLFAYSTTGLTGSYTPYSPNRVVCVECHQWYYIQMIDSCGNFFTIPKFFLECPPKKLNEKTKYKIQCVPNTRSTITLVDSNGNSPAGNTYILNRDSTKLPSLSNHTGTFTIPPQCPRYALMIKNPVNKIIAIDSFRCPALAPVMRCGDCTHGTATVELNGGIPPYSVRAYTTNGTKLVDSSSTGVFTHLPIHPTGGAYSFKVTDACGADNFVLRRDCLKASLIGDCPFTGKVLLNFLGTTPNGNTYDTSVYFPMTFTCTTCSPVQTTVVHGVHGDGDTRYGDSLSVSGTLLFTGVPLGSNQTVRIQDSCGADETDVFTIQSGGSYVIKLKPDPCKQIVATSIDALLSDTLAQNHRGAVFYLVDSVTGQKVDSNYNGYFKNLGTGHYYIYMGGNGCFNSTRVPFSIVPKADTIKPICIAYFYDSLCRLHTNNFKFPTITIVHHQNYQIA
jgi:hypothetical protein